MYRIFILVFLWMAACALPSTDGPRGDAKSTLMRYLSAWQKGDHATLFTLTCAQDRAAIEVFKENSMGAAAKAKTLGFSHSMQPVHEHALLSALIGKAPEDMSLKIPTRFALKRSSLSDEGTLGAWSLSKEGAEYFVCLSEDSRAELQKQLAEVKKLLEVLDREAESRAITVDE